MIARTCVNSRPSSASTVDDRELEEGLEQERYADLAQDLKEDAAASPATPAGMCRPMGWGLLLLPRPLSGFHLHLHPSSAASAPLPPTAVPTETVHIVSFHAHADAAPELGSGYQAVGLTYGEDEPAKEDAKAAAVFKPAFTVPPAHWHATRGMTEQQHKVMRSGS